MDHLKKELTLFDLVFYGIGIILGAGVYALIGPAAALAGNGLWASFILAAIVASFTGLSYAELSSMYPRDAAEYTFVKTAFKDTTFGFVIGWLTFFTAVVAGSVVALGFGKYFSALTGISALAGSAGIVIAFAVINYLGIKISSRLNILLSSLTVLGLFIIIAIGAPSIGSVNYFESPIGIIGIIGAATLVFFAYLGFDDIVNVAEEAKNARKNVPKAIMISIIITTIIYVLVSISVVSVVPWQQLGKSETPLALVASTSFGSSAGSLISLFALFATAGTIFVLMIASSRMLYGMAEYGVMPRLLLRLHKKRKTPYVSIIVITAIALAFIFLAGLKETALLVDFSAFFVFAMINLSAFALRFTQPDAKRLFRTPLAIGRVSILPLAGFLISSYMLLQFPAQMIWYGIMIMIAGYIFYKFFEEGKKL